MSDDLTARAPTRIIAGLGLMFIVIAVALALSGPMPTGEQWIAIALLLPLHVIAQHTEFVHGINSSVPTQPVLVGLLLLAPPEVVPLCLVAAVLLSGIRSGGSLLDWGSRFVNGWYSLGPVLVLAIAQPGLLDWHNWWVFLVALAAQFLIDLASAVGFELLMARPPEAILKPLAWNQAVDLCLSVISFCAVVAADGSLWSIPLLAAPIGLIALMIQDRQALATDRRSLDEEVTQVRTEARIDQLTGLGNRRAWTEALTEVEQQLARGDIRRVGVVMADLNNLKLINDSRGHDAGDELLRTMGRLFAAATPDGATSARVGGDEFAMLLPDPGLTGVKDLIVRLEAALAAHPGIDGIALSAAVGGAAHPPALDVAQAVVDADAAALAAKRTHRARRIGDSRLPSPRRHDGERWPIDRTRD